MPAISVCVLCMNEEVKIGAALESVKWADEIVVVDSGSTDATLTIARQYTDKVFFREWTDFSDARNYIASLASHEWVFFLDADEEVSARLAHEIRGMADDVWNRAGAMDMPRRNYLGGKYIRCYSPDRVRRLYHLNRTSQRKGRFVHDARDIIEGQLVRLRNPIYHNRAAPYDWNDFFSGRRLDERLPFLVQELRDRNRKPALTDLTLRPVLTFMKYFILKGGITQGRFGLVFAWKAMVGVVLKYSKLYLDDSFAEGDEKRSG